MLRTLTAVGFEPTPLRNGALSHRLRPLGQTVLNVCDGSEPRTQAISQIRFHWESCALYNFGNQCINYSNTVAILAQGTHWADALAQAYCSHIRPFTVIGPCVLKQRFLD